MEFSRKLKWFAIPFSSGSCFVRPWLSGTCTLAAPQAIGHAWALARTLEFAKLHWPPGAGQGATRGPGQRPCCSCCLESIDTGGFPGAEGSLASLLLVATPGAHLQSRSCGEWRAPQHRHCCWPPWGQSTMGFSFYRDPSESVLMRWVKLEFTIQSKVSQKEKKKSILTHIYGI